MRQLLLFLALLWVSTGFMTCCSVEAAEPVAEAGAHVAGDEDHVPADEHGNYPHHHKSCSGHDVSTGAVRIAGPAWAYESDQYGSGRLISIAEAPPGENLRPPKA